MADRRVDIRRIAALALLVVALVSLAYAIRGATHRPPASNADEIPVVCTACWQESLLTTEEIEATMDDETDLLRCPKCGEMAASPVSRYCPQCRRAIPRSMVVFGTAYVCPFCGAGLGTDSAAAPRP